MGLRKPVTALLIAFVLPVSAQQPAPVAVPIERPVTVRDAQVEAANALIGRAVFLRCFCAENNLSFDAAGRPLGNVKATDWTLAAFDVQKAERRGPGSVVLDGVRVAVRYDAQAREFVRKPQKDEKIHIQIADSGDARQFVRALETAFAVGIDLPLQQAMPKYWQHYFNPRMPAKPDALSTETIYLPGAAGYVFGPGNAPLVPPAGSRPVEVLPPSVTHRGALSYTTLAARDRVKGVVQLRIVTDAQGVPQRVSIGQPLGYGLDARAVKAAEKYRFSPAMRDGKPVASSVLMNEEFTLVEQPVTE